ncbi:unnamed protein product [Acanthosepion pharaonis]|uniref:Uncharacterized protein n=1 Tax=Acanthosepion pharaonis TaxID=158019 RepID=A0A812DMS3_ACAPH|nr:unnamed protein product [Sepia pharaonis]
MLPSASPFLSFRLKDESRFFLIADISVTHVTLHHFNAENLHFFSSVCTTLGKGRRRLLLFDRSELFSLNGVRTSKLLRPHSFLLSLSAFICSCFCVDNKPSFLLSPFSLSFNTRSLCSVFYFSKPFFLFLLPLRPFCNITSLSLSLSLSLFLSFVF